MWSLVDVDVVESRRLPYLHVPHRVQLPCKLACCGSLFLVIPPLFGVVETLDFIMLKISMSVKVKV